MHYSLKMRNAQAFSRKGLADVLYGHTAGVSSICLLPASNLLATGIVLGQTTSLAAYKVQLERHYKLFLRQENS